MWLALSNCRITSRSEYNISFVQWKDQKWVEMISKKYKNLLDSLPEKKKSVIWNLGVLQKFATIAKLWLQWSQVGQKRLAYWTYIINEVDLHFWVDILKLSERRVHDVWTGAQFHGFYFTVFMYNTRIQKHQKSWITLSPIEYYALTPNIIRPFILSSHSSRCNFDSALDSIVLIPHPYVRLYNGIIYIQIEYYQCESISYCWAFVSELKSCTVWSCMLTCRGF